MICMENKNHKEKRKGGKADTEFYIQIGIIVILVFVIVFSAGKIYSPNGASTEIKTISASEIIPTGIPAVYGAELGVNFDDVSASNPRSADATIRKLKENQDMELDEAQMKRYVRIGSSIACEYCCGAKSLIFADGSKACGCSHSGSMRGLAKYLLVNHPDMSDEEILTELAKWKVLFFPGIMQKKAQLLEAQGIDYKNYINLASNLYRGIEKGQTSGNGGGMVGGC